MDSGYAFWPTLTLVIGTFAWIVGTRLRRGSMLSPFSLIVLILVSIFGIRPLLMPDEPESFSFYGYNIAQGYEMAALLGFLGIMAFIIGYAFRRFTSTPLNPKAKPKDEAPTDRLDTSTPKRALMAAWLLIAGWFLAMIVIGGGAAYIGLLFQGRSDATRAALAGVPAVVSALPVVACLVIATVRFQFERFQTFSRKQNIAYWLVGIVAVIPPSALGTRRFLIPSLIIVLIGALAHSWNRRVKVTYLIGGAVAFLALAIIPFVRSAGSRMSGHTNLLDAMGYYFRHEGIKGTLSNFFLSYDTEMFNYVAYLAPRMGETIPFGMGKGTIGELLAMPIPASISPFTIWNDQLLIYIFGYGCTIESACPVPSIIGVLYSDLAMPGLIMGMVILGILAANFENSMLRSSGTYTGLLLLVAGFAVVFARGNSVSQMWLAFQCFVVWWVVHKLILHAPSLGPAKPRLVAPQSRPRKSHLGQGRNRHYRPDLAAAINKSQPNRRPQR